MIADLDREIANEEKRAGISDPSPFRLSDLRPRRDRAGATI